MVKHAIGFIGMPGVGKTTHAKKIDDLGYHYFSAQTLLKSGTALSINRMVIDDLPVDPGEIDRLIADLQKNGWQVSIMFLSLDRVQVYLRIAGRAGSDGYKDEIHRENVTKKLEGYESVLPVLFSYIQPKVNFHSSVHVAGPIVDTARTLRSLLIQHFNSASQMEELKAQRLAASA